MKGQTVERMQCSQQQAPCRGHPCSCPSRRRLPPPPRSEPRYIPIDQPNSTNCSPSSCYRYPSTNPWSARSLQLFPSIFELLPDCQPVRSSAQPDPTPSPPLALDSSTLRSSPFGCLPSRKPFGSAYFMNTITMGSLNDLQIVPTDILQIIQSHRNAPHSHGSPSRVGGSEQWRYHTIHSSKSLPSLSSVHASILSSRWRGALAPSQQPSGHTRVRVRDPDQHRLVAFQCRPTPSVSESPLPNTSTHISPIYSAPPSSAYLCFCPVSPRCSSAQCQRQTTTIVGISNTYRI